jgi:hypothetical protein
MKFFFSIHSFIHLYFFILKKCYKCKNYLYIFFIEYFCILNCLLISCFENIK